MTYSSIFLRISADKREEENILFWKDYQLIRFVPSNLINARYILYKYTVCTSDDAVPCPWFLIMLSRTKK